jgi:hypothetical protein
LFLLVSLSLLTSCNEFKGCGIVREKHLTSDGGGCLVIELENGRMIKVDGVGSGWMDEDVWANAKVGEKYCQ